MSLTCVSPLVVCLTTGVLGWVTGESGWVACVTTEVPAEPVPEELLLDPPPCRLAFTAEAADVTGFAAALTADPTDERAEDGADPRGDRVSRVDACACLENSIMTTKIPAATIASCIARMATRRAIGCGMSTPLARNRKIRHVLPVFRGSMRRAWADLQPKIMTCCSATNVQGFRLVGQEGWKERRSLGTGRLKAWPSDELMGVPDMAGREQVIAALKAAYVQGRLTKEEFEIRVGQVLAIYAELDALTADIPAAPPAVTVLAAAEPPAAEPAVAARAELAREAANKKMIRQGTAGVAGLTFVLVMAAGMPYNPVFAVIVGVLLTSFVAVLAAGLLTLLSWALDRRSDAQGAGDAGGAGPAQGLSPGTADQEGRRPELGQDPPGTVQAAKSRPHRLATSPA